MRIRTKLALAIVITGLLSLSAIVFVLSAAERADETADKQARAATISREAVGLLVLTQEYARYSEARAAEQWQRRHTSLTLALSEEGKGAALPPELSEVRGDVEELPALFARLESVGLLPTGEIAMHQRELLLDQLLSRTQTVWELAHEWNAQTREAQRHAETRFETAAIVAPMLMLVLMAMLAMLFRKRVLQPLAFLQSATAKIRQGESVRTDTGTQDEIGELSREFDAMTAALARRTNELEESNRNLDAEVDQRRESERRIRTITDNIPALIAHLDTEQRYLFSNATANTLFDGDRGTLVGVTLREARGERLYAEFRPHVEAALRGESRDFEFQWDGSGTSKHYHATYVPDRDTAGRVAGFYALIFDITERKRAEAQIAASEERLRAITDNVPAFISYVDSKSCLRFVNQRLARWLGKEPEALIGKPVSEALSEEIYALHRDQLQEALKGKRMDYEVEANVRGQMRAFQFSLIPDLGPDDSVLGAYTISTNITALKENEKRLSRLALHDTLTGLPNRPHFHERLEAQMQNTRLSGKAMALMFLDIDRFKSINDTHGHAVGDLVLKTFGERLGNAVRSADMVARLGGDEFTIILEGMSETGPWEFVAKKIIAAVNQPMRAGDLKLSISTSIGIVFYAGEAIDAEALLAAADAALYEAKSAGRNTYQRYSLSAMSRSSAV